MAVKSNDKERLDVLDEFMEENPGEETKLDIQQEAAAEESLGIAPDLSSGDPDSESMLDIAADVPVQVVAVMGKKNVTLKEIAGLKMGEVIELSRPANEIVDLVAGGRLIAKGELVEIEGKLGVRIVKMVR